MVIQWTLHSVHFAIYCRDIAKTVVLWAWRIISSKGANKCLSKWAALKYHCLNIKREMFSHPSSGKQIYGIVTNEDESWWPPTVNLVTKTARTETPEELSSNVPEFYGNIFDHFSGEKISPLFIGEDPPKKELGVL